MNNMDVIPGTNRKPIAAKTRPARNTFYNSQGWRNIRAVVVKEEPICRLSGDQTHSVDHIDGNNKNNKRSNLQGLSLTTHSWKTNVFEKQEKLSAIVSADALSAKLPVITHFVPCEPFICEIQFFTAFYATLYLNIFDRLYFNAWKSSAVRECERLDTELTNWKYYAYSYRHGEHTKDVLESMLPRDCELSGIPYPTALQYALLKYRYEEYRNAN